MNLFRRIKKLFVDTFIFIISLFFVRDEKRIALGAWVGKLYADNSKYLLEAMLESLDDSYSFVWIGEDELCSVMPNDKRVVLLPKNSFKSIKQLLTCKYFFCSQFAEIDICTYNVYQGACITYLHHGFPIKRIGEDKVGHSLKKKSIVPQKWRDKMYLRYDYFVVSSAIQRRIFLGAFRTIGCEENKLINSGTPRNDYLINMTQNECDRLRKEFSKKYNITETMKLIVYLPTFRRSGTTVPSLFLNRNSEEKGELIKILDEYDCFLVEKGHFADHSILKENSNVNDYRYLCLSEQVNTQELLACADVLISDYSGAFIDYLLLDRPIIHYLFDYDYYRLKDSGLYFSINEFACGDVAYTYNELLASVRRLLSEGDTFQDLRKAKRLEYLEFEHGQASKTIIDRVFSTDKT